MGGQQGNMGHSSFFKHSPAKKTGHKLSGDGEQCCLPEDLYPTALEQVGSDLILTLSDGSTIIAPLTALTPATTIANTLYVHTNGSDVTGTRERWDLPFATPWAAVAAANAGDTVIVSAGTYTLIGTGTEKIVKDGVRVLMAPGAVLVVDATSTTQPLSDDGVAIVSYIYGEGSIVWQRAVDMQLTSNAGTELYIRLSSLSGVGMISTVYDTLHIDIDDVTGCVLSVLPGANISGTSLIYCVKRYTGGGIAGKSQVRIIPSVGITISSSRIEIDVNMELGTVTLPVYNIDGIGADTHVVLRGNVRDVAGTQSAHLLQLGSSLSSSVLSVDIRASWAYGLLVVPVGVGCNGRGIISLSGHISDHASAGDIDVRGVQGGLHLRLDLLVEGDTNLLGVLRVSSSANGSVRACNISGMVRSQSITCPPIYLDAPAIASQAASLSSLTIMANTVNVNNVNIGPGTITMQINKVRSSKPVAAALFIQQGEVMQIVATTVI